MKYVYLYMDRDQIEATSAKLKKLRFVKRVEVSYRPDLDMNFGARIGELGESEDQTDAGD